MPSRRPPGCTRGRSTATTTTCPTCAGTTPSTPGRRRRRASTWRAGSTPRACGCASASTTAACARQLDVPFPNGSSDVDLVASTVPVDERRVLAAMVFVRDSPRRLRGRAQRAPRRVGLTGWLARARRVARRERRARDPRGDRPAPRPGARAPLRLRAIHAPHRRQHHSTRTKPVPPGLPHRARRGVDPTLTHGDDGIHETRWVSPQEYAALCAHLFWWPLAGRGVPGPAGSRPTPLSRTMPPTGWTACRQPLRHTDVRPWAREVQRVRGRVPAGPPGSGLAPASW